MNTRSLLFSLLLLAVSGAQAQSLPADVGSLPARPLNLSLRPAKALTDAALIVPEQAAKATDPVPEQAATQLPYGAGFETRHRGGTSGSSAGSSGGSGGSGGGRGGSGRGR